MDALLGYIKNNPGAIPGIFLVIIAFLNARHATEQQDAAFDMPENSDIKKFAVISAYWKQEYGFLAIG